MFKIHSFSESKATDNDSADIEQKAIQLTIGKQRIKS